MLLFLELNPHITTASAAHVLLLRLGQQSSTPPPWPTRPRRHSLAPIPNVRSCSCLDMVLFQQLCLLSNPSAAASPHRYLRSLQHHRTVVQSLTRSVVISTTTDRRHLCSDPAPKYDPDPAAPPRSRSASIRAASIPTDPSCINPICAASPPTTLQTQSRQSETQRLSICRPSGFRSDDVASAPARPRSDGFALIRRPLNQHCLDPASGPPQ